MPATAISFFLVFLFPVLGMKPGVLHTLSKHRVTELCPWSHECHLYSEKEMEIMNTRRIERPLVTRLTAYMILLRLRTHKMFT